MFGAIVGLVVGCGGLFAPAGSSFFAVGIAASVAAAAAWFSAGQEWPTQRLAALAAGAVPGTALIIVLICGGGLASLIASATAAAVSGALVWWRRDDLLRRLTGEAG